MAISSEFARYAPQVAYHQIAEVDTAADLEEWLDGFGNLPGDSLVWIRDNEDGTFSIWGAYSTGWDSYGPVAVGDFIAWSSGGPLGITSTQFDSQYLL